MGKYEKIIDVELDFCYEGEKVPALKGIRGCIAPGKCIVLCGSSGCGKSTMLRCINRLIPQFYEGEMKGFVHVNGQNVDALSIGEMGEIVSSVFQDPRSQFFTMNSSTEVAFGMENYGVSGEAMTRRVEEAFQQFQLEKLKDRKVFELSSGERQLVAILSAWALNTDIFLLDEPTANLDHAAIHKLGEILLSLKQQGKTLLINEHRLYYLSGIADEYWFMEKGEITRRFTAKEMQGLTEDELCEIGLRTTDQARIVPADNRMAVCAERGDVITAQGICFGYPKSGDVVLLGVSLEAYTGEVIGLIGSNGCGKTTFGKIAAGLFKPSAGKILFNGHAMSGKALAAQSIFIMQEAEFQFFTNSVRNELEYGREMTTGLRTRIDELLKRSGLWECRDRHPFSLSGGQMQKLTLLLAYLSPKPIVILDEPTAGLDRKSLQNCVQIIEEMRKQKIVFIITHDLELISQSCTRCICLSKGKVETEFDLSEASGFYRLKEHMEQTFRLSDNWRTVKNTAYLNRCDPRINLLYIIVSMIVAVTADIPLTCMVFLAVALFALYEKQYKAVLYGGTVFGLIFGLFYLFPDSIMYFAASFFPRIILVSTAVAAAGSNEGAARILSALRRLHVPEKVIMICSVVFRFFPVLSNDLKLMSQSVKTRGFFTTVGEKIRAIPEYLEIMIVPMAFRVIRIAEALSASAETRGIDLKRKRNSYITLKFTNADICMTALLACMVTVGVLI